MNPMSRLTAVEGVGDRTKDLDRQLGRLVLALVDLIRRLMERQAQRRLSAGKLTDAQIESLGLGLSRLATKVAELKTAFSLEGETDLCLSGVDDGKLDLVDTLDRVLSQGLSLQGDIVLSLADVDLVRLGVSLVAASVDTLESRSAPLSTN